jgi:hypothetical protein
VALLPGGADLCFLASCGIAVENKEVWQAAETESINPAAANGERVCRVALLKDKNGATHYSKFFGKDFDEAQDRCLEWIRQNLSVDNTSAIEIHDLDYFTNRVWPVLKSEFRGRSEER